MTNANNKTLTQIAKDTKSLVEKARDGKLKPEEYTGGTVTISNLGMSVVDHFSAIINPPQSIILAVSRTKKEWVPKEGCKHGGKWASMMNVCLSCDHRVVDGAIAAKWLGSFKDFIENPMSLAL